MQKYITSLNWMEPEPTTTDLEVLFRYVRLQSKDMIQCPEMNPALEHPGKLCEDKEQNF